MRPIRLLSVVLSFPLLVSCATDRNTIHSDRAPGLDVGAVALTNGAPDSALSIAQRTLATDPHNVPALLLAAQAQTALGQRDQAAETFARVLAITPDNDAASLGLGRLKLQTDPAEASNILLRLTARDPHNVPALIDLGIARDMLGQHADAQRAYHDALSIDPGRIATNINLGLSLALSGDTQQALTILRPIALTPGASPRMRQNLAVALVLAGDEKEAAQVLQTDMDQPAVVAALSGYHSLRMTQ